MFFHIEQMCASVRARHRLVIGIAGALTLASIAGGQSAAPGPVSPASSVVPVSIPAKATRIETEIVTLSNQSAYPSEIHRHPGKFFLLILTQGHSDPGALLFDSPGLSAAQLPQLASAVDFSVFQQHRRTAGLLNLPAGEFDLKSQTTGKVLLKITIQ
jgi:hypothetical protein